VSLTKEEIADWRRVVQHLRQQGAEVSPMKPAKQQQPTLPDIELTMDSHGMLIAASRIAAGAVILPPSILDLDKALSHCDSPNVHRFSWVENGAHFVLVAAISDIYPGDTLWINRYFPPFLSQVPLNSEAIPPRVIEYAQGQIRARLWDMERANGGGMSHAEYLQYKEQQAHIFWILEAMRRLRNGSRDSVRES
jgi:hypothetical protein